MSDHVLTARQRQILDCIDTAMRDRGYPPSVREIGESVGLGSPSTVHSHLSTLQRLGYLRRDPSKPRAIEVRFDPSRCHASPEVTPGSLTVSGVSAGSVVGPVVGPVVARAGLGHAGPPSRITATTVAREIDRMTGSREVGAMPAILACAGPRRGQRRRMTVTTRPKICTSSASNTMGLRRSFWGMSTTWWPLRS